MKALEPGCLVVVRYYDHVLFKDVDPSLQKTFVRESVGWLDCEDADSVRIVWERFSMPDYPNESKPRATGLVLLKSAIVEIRDVG